MMVRALILFLGCVAIVRLGFATSMLSMRLRANDTDSIDIWRTNLAAIVEHPGCCDEIWFSTGTGAPSLDWHRNRAAVLARAVEDVRSRGIVPSLQFQATIGHGDAFGSPEMFARKSWTGWTGWQGIETKYCNCPRQMAFHAYLREVSEIYAPLGFARLWIDDDLRIGHHQPAESYGRRIGCWCETCIKAFNEKTGANWTRDPLQKAVQKDELLAASWRRFSIDSIVGVARTIAAEFKARSPATRMALQHASGEDSVDQVKAVLQALHEVSENPVGCRPGGGAYYDDNPNLVVRKSLQSGWFRGRLAELDFVDVWTPEIESWPRTYYSRSPQGVLVEGFSSLMYGMNSVSFFISNGAKEKASLYGRTYWKTLAGASAVLQDYARTIADCEPVGLVMPGPVAIGVRRVAIPVLSGIGRCVGTLTEGERKLNVNQMTSDEVQALRNSLDRRVGGLPALVKSPFFGLMQIHVDGNGLLRSVALLNMRISEQGPVRIVLRQMPLAWKTVVWHEMNRPPVILPLERCGSDTVVAIPSVGAWNGGYLSGSR